MECPYSTVEVEGHLLDSELWEVAEFMGLMGLTFKISNFMMGLDALIIDEDIPGFRSFLNLISRNYVKSRFKCPFEKVEIKSDLQSHDLKNVTVLLEQSKIKTIKLPDCMKGTETLLVNNHHKECRGFLKLFTKSKLLVDETTLNKVEICSDLSFEEILYTETSFTYSVLRTTDSPQGVLLELKIPDKMIGSCSLIIDMDVPECRWFLKFVY